MIVDNDASGVKPLREGVSRPYLGSCIVSLVPYDNESRKGLTRYGYCNIRVSRDLQPPLPSFPTSFDSTPHDRMLLHRQQQSLHQKGQDGRLLSFSYI